ncbi:unnamed protein product [Lymnaea stagnalis]|uniref:Uncharacterized protein n=1 Tax=Lymnaea stagnalis TaxID=6523 RepID=A0AAV2HRT9_LYMST
MSNSELPPTSGRSVFSVFGFSSNHYADIDDFDSPLESAPDSFSGADPPALTRRRGARKKSDELVPFTSTEGGQLRVDYPSPSTVNPSSDPNIPKHFWAAFFAGDAQKMRLGIPDNSKLVLQSLAHTSSKPNPGHHTSQQSALEKHHLFTRRYSNPQGDPVEDTFDTEVLHKFNVTVSDSSKLILPKQNTQRNLYSNYSPYSKDDSLPPHDTKMVGSSGAPCLPRRQSTPNLLGLSSLQTFNQSKSFCVPHSDSSVDPEKHTSALATYVAQQSNDMSVAKLTDSNKLDSNKLDNNAMLTSAAQRVQNPVLLDSADGATHIEKPQGFGFLSRTRQFGAWLTKATEGERVEITKKDLNVLAPNSF